jgi:lysophospholipase L1-like esterase
VDAAAYRTFLNTIAFAKSRGVNVVLVNMPTVDIINRIDAEKREQVRDLFRKLAKDDPHVVFLDYSRAFENRYDLFYDTIHMNAKGQRVVTEDLAKRLKEVLH